MFEKAHEFYAPISEEERQERLRAYPKRYIEDLIDKGEAKQNSDGSYDVFKNVDILNIFSPLIHSKISKLPLKFKNVDTTFSCSHLGLETLEGCPEYVGGSFFSSSNKLDSLKYGPIHVELNYNCIQNYLENLEGFPKYVGGNLLCFNQYSGKHFTEEEIRAVCDVRGRVILNQNQVLPPRITSGHG